MKQFILIILMLSGFTLVNVQSSYAFVEDILYKEDANLITFARDLIRKDNHQKERGLNKKVKRTWLDNYKLMKS